MANVLTQGSRQDRAKVLFLLSMFPLAWFSMKLSMPALPTLVRVFHSAALVKLSVTVFFVCYAIGQLLWGLLSHIYSRRLCVMAGLLLMIIGTVIIVITPSMAIYMVGRGCEGFGAAMLSPLGRAMIGDAYQSRDIGFIMTLASVICCTIPTVGPIVGSIILVHAGWRMIFGCFLGILMIYFVIAWLELSHIQQSQVYVKPSWQTLKDDYTMILSSSRFWSYSMCYMLCSGTLLSYYAAMPFWFVSQWHVSDVVYPYYGWITVGSYLIGMWLNHILIKKLAIKTCCQLGCYCVAAAAFITWLMFFMGIHGVLAICVAMAVFALGAGINMPIANVVLLGAFPGRVSLISGLTASSMSFAIAILSWVEMHLQVHTMQELAYFLLAVACVLLFFFHMFIQNDSYSMSST